MDHEDCSNQPDDNGPNEEEPLSFNPIENNEPEEQEEDFPDHSNEQNKQLNQIVILFLSFF